MTERQVADAPGAREVEQAPLPAPPPVPVRRSHESLKVTLLTASFSDIQLLRAQCLTLLAEHLGHTVTVVTTQPGDVLPSLASSPFAATLRRVAPSELVDIVRDQTDVLCAVKALEVSLGLGRRAAGMTGTPLLADIDDPDIEARTIASARTRARAVQKMGKAWRTLPGHARMAVAARRSTSSVSNPVLKARWGGTVVPHARPRPGDGAPHTTDRPTIAFVGTPKTHKGIHLLRQAVSRLSDEGWRLTVTAAPPADARPWETWVGPLDGTYDSAVLTAESDVVVIPSLDYGWARAQLPLKLVDAMLVGRAVVVSDVGPLPWAVGQAGSVFSAGSVDALVDALRPLADPVVRARAGAAAREHALGSYTVEAVAPAFQQALENARTNL